MEIGQMHMPTGWLMTTGSKAIEPKKSLGQHWLIDNQALEDILELSNIQPTDEVVEIGPGMGVLTKLLAKDAKHVTAVELDTDLVKHLNNLKLENVDIHN